MALIPGTFLALCLSAAKGFGRVVRAAANRRQARALTEWDARALKDIGLTQSDVVGALSLPYHRDPTEHLATLSGRSPRWTEDTLRKEGVKQKPKISARPEPLPSNRPALLA
jgi:uncharacterized protein YjiS (DUF1127 family)